MRDVALGSYPGYYRACGNKCAFNLKDSGLSCVEAARQLLERGFGITNVDVTELAKSLVGKGQWKWAARSWDAPERFDCSSLTKWLYAQKGIWLPRRAHQQFEHCNCNTIIMRSEGSVEKMSNTPGNLIFVSSPYSGGKKTDKQTSLHVGIVVASGMVVCATNSELGTGVVEVSLEQLLQTRELIGVGRPFRWNDDPVTLITPEEREIETSDDIRYMFPNFRRRDSSVIHLLRPEVLP